MNKDFLPNFVSLFFKYFDLLTAVANLFLIVRILDSNELAEYFVLLAYVGICNTFKVLGYSSLLYNSISFKNECIFSRNYLFSELLLSFTFSSLLVDCLLFIFSVFLDITTKELFLIIFISLVQSLISLGSVFLRIVGKLILANFLDFSSKSSPLFLCYMIIYLEGIKISTNEIMLIYLLFISIYLFVIFFSLAKFQFKFTMEMNFRKSWGVLSKSSKLAGSTAVVNLYRTLDLIALSYFVSSYELNSYKITMTLAYACTAVYSVFATNAYPLFNKIILGTVLSTSHEVISYVRKTLIIVLTFYIFILSVYFGLGETLIAFIDSLLDDKDIILVNSIFVLMMVIYIAQTILGYGSEYLQVKNESNFLLITSLYSLAFASISFLFFVKRFGILGSSLAVGLATLSFSYQAFKRANKSIKIGLV